MMVLMVPAAGGFALVAHFLGGSLSQLGRRSGPVVGVFGVAVTVLAVVLARELLEGNSVLGTAISSVTLGSASAVAAIYFAFGLRRVRM